MYRVRLLGAVVLVAGMLGCKAQVSGEPPKPAIAEDPSSQAPAAIVVSGQLLDHQGAPLRAASVVIGRANSREEVTTPTVDADGNFSLELPGPGVYMLRLAGVDHAEQRASMLVDHGSVEIHAQLGTYARQLDPDALKLRLRYLGQDDKAGATGEAMAQPRSEREGEFLVELDPPAGTKAVQYQLVDATGRTYNGPGATHWVYDGGGDFWAQRPLGDETQLEIDLAALAPSGLDGTVSIVGEAVWTPRHEEAIEALGDAQAQVYALYGKELEPHERCAEVEPLAADARARVEAIDDRELQVYAALTWGELFGPFSSSACIAADDLAWVFELAPPEHRAWAFATFKVAQILGGYRSELLNDPAIVSFRARLSEARSEPGLRAHLLYLELYAASAREDQAAIAELWATAERDYPNASTTAWAQSSFDPDRPLQVGHSMPEWDFANLDGGRISSADLAGQPYLIEVWATWCGPCVADMPKLHAAYEIVQAAPTPVQFVSVSIDDTPGPVVTFRRDQFPMDWLNAHVPESEHKALYEAWQFSGVPLPVLVDGEGVIVAIDGALRDDHLLSTLEAFVAGN